MGNQLFKKVADLTGLPTELISDELSDILAKVGSTPSVVQMEELRAAMATYLHEVMLSSEESVDGTECATSDVSENVEDNGTDLSH